MLRPRLRAGSGATNFANGGLWARTKPSQWTKTNRSPGSRARASHWTPQLRTASSKPGLRVLKGKRVCRPDLSSRHSRQQGQGCADLG